MALKLRRYISKALHRNRLGLAIRNILTKNYPILISERCELLIRTGGVEGKTVLEVGPGKTGGILPEVKFWGGHEMAVEVDPVAAQSIAELGHIVYSDILEIKQKVDIINASMILEHVKNPGNMLKKLAEITVPEGRILVSVPNAGQALSLGVNWIGFRVDLEHLNYFDQRSLNALLSKAGYDTECIWITSQPMLPAYLPMADRNKFIQYVKNKSKRRVKLDHDPFGAIGEFTLTVLARYNKYQ